MTNEQKIKNAILLAAEYFRFQMSESVLNIYWEVLKKYDSPEVERALMKFIKDPSVRFMPLAAEISNAIPERKLEKRELDQSTEAERAKVRDFSEIRNRIARMGEAK